MNPPLSIILVSYNERECLRGALRLLEQEFARDEAEVIVVDNDSKDDSAAMTRTEFPWAHLIETHANLMYGKGNNVGFEAARGDWLMVLNPDVEWKSGALKTFFAAAKKIQNLGAAGPQVRYPDGRIQVTAHHAFPSRWSVFTDYCLPLQQTLLRLPFHPMLDSAAKHTGSHRVAHLTGICLLVPRSVYEKIGGFDPAFTMYLEETDWQKRMHDAGLDCWFVADSAITHFGSAQKSFSQANRNFLWGLELYTRKHWTGPGRRAKLVSAMWTGEIMSMMFLITAWPFSWLIGRPGARIRHYLRQYGRLWKNLVGFPTDSPPI